MKRNGFPLGVLLPVLLLLLVGLVPAAQAQPFTVELGYATITVTSWTLYADQQYAVVNGSVSQKLPVDILLLGVVGQAETLDGTVLGTGRFSSQMPVLLPPNRQVSLQAALNSVYSSAQIGSMLGPNFQQVRVKFTVEYCIPWLFGCYGPLYLAFDKIYSVSYLLEMWAQVRDGGS